MILRTAKVWARIVDDYKPLPENKRGPGRVLTPEEEKRLFEVAASNPRWDAAYFAAQLSQLTQRLVAANSGVCALLILI